MQLFSHQLSLPLGLILRFLTVDYLHQKDCHIRYTRRHLVHQKYLYPQLHLELICMGREVQRTVFSLKSSFELLKVQVVYGNLFLFLVNLLLQLKLL